MEFIVNTISVRQLQRMTFHSHRFLLDLRDPEDFDEGHLPGAVNYPYKEMESWKNQLPLGPEYIIICDHGNAALRAAGELKKLGHRTAAVVGGYSFL